MSDGSESECPILPMKIQKVADMYEHWSVYDNDTVSLNQIPTAASKTADSGSYDSTSIEDEDCIVFVHGWRMKIWERRAFAHTSFKRLWHAGYKGRFFHFSWPTEWTARLTGGWKGFFDKVGNPPNDKDNYADSAEKAYRSGTALFNFLKQLGSEYGPEKVRLMAHSMGNIVASEALRIQTKQSSSKLIESFIACQAAMSAHAYDSTAPDRAPTVYNAGSWDTPEKYASYPFTGNPYFSGLGSAARMVNFYNPNDDALSGWVIGQDLKPNNWPSFNDMPLSPDEGYRCNYSSGFLIASPPWPVGQFHQLDNLLDSRELLYFPENTHEIYAHAAESRSLALGATSVANMENYDLSSIFSKDEYNLTVAREDHSGQYNSILMRRHEFWSEILKRFRIELEKK